MSDHKTEKFQDIGVNRTRGVRSLPMLGAVLLLGLTLYASRCGGAARGRHHPAGPGRTRREGRRQGGGCGQRLPGVARRRAAHKVALPFDSGKKPGWSNLPVTMVPRNGIRLGDLTKKQRAAALEALAAVLSKQATRR